MRNSEISEKLVVIRGAGDIATASALKLHNSGFSVVLLEIEKPTVIRTTVSFAQACFDGTATVEGVTAVLCTLSDVPSVLSSGFIPLIIDSCASSLSVLKPDAVVDAVLAKKNLGTSIDMAPAVVALGPGFTAGEDCHAVIETMRGHTLGKVIYSGRAIENTGIPGVIAGFGKERVVRSPATGVFVQNAEIGDIVKSGDTIAFVGGVPVKCEISGKLRGLLNGGLYVPSGFKVADVDPRGISVDHTSCSDKARAVAGGTLEAVMHLLFASGGK